MPGTWEAIAFVASKISLPGSAFNALGEALCQVRNSLRIHPLSFTVLPNHFFCFSLLGLVRLAPNQTFASCKVDFIIR